MFKKILGVLVVLILGLTGSVWALTSPPMTSRVSVITPTGVSMTITRWTGLTAPANTVDFSLGATGTAYPGKTSWSDGDGWTSLDANVGYTATCIGPSGSRLTVSCGKMTDGTTHEIPYESADGLTDYFGFSAKLEDGTYVAGSLTTMQPHSLAGWTYTFPAGVTGHDFAIFNVLKIPANAVAGTYSTTGVGNYAHELLTFI